MSTSVKKISIKDIAKELNLSITTVSFVLNGKGKKMGISPETNNRVHALIKKRGFKPNNAARMLRNGKSKTIGLIVEDISNSFFGRIAKVIEVEANKNGYSVFFSSTENNNATAKKLINKMKDSSVDGYIITATQGLKTEILKLKEENIPFVLIDRLVPGVDADYVILDNYTGAYNLTKHLIDNNYTKIGFVTIENGMSQMIDRERGYNDALANAKIKTGYNSILKVALGQSDEVIVDRIKNFIAENPAIDSLFFSTNYLGVFGIEAIQKNNLKIPSNIAVVSFDDNVFFKLLTPSITVAAQPIKEIATKAIQHLLKKIESDNKQSRPYGQIIMPDIIVRNSSPKRKLHAK